MRLVPPLPPKMPMRFHQRIGKWGTDLGKNGLLAFLISIAVILLFFLALAIL